MNSTLKRDTDFVMGIIEQRAQVLAEEMVRNISNDILGSVSSSTIKRGPGRPKKLVLKTFPQVKQPRLPYSLARRAAMKTQGQYLGVIRGLKGADRANVMKMAKEKGAKEALAFGKKLRANLSKKK